MWFLLSIFLLATQATKLVEYRFGLNYGTLFYDFSGNSNHGYVYKFGFFSSVIKCTDRGIYFRGKKDSVVVKKFDFTYTMSVLLWVLPDSGDGYVYFQYAYSNYRRSVKFYVAGTSGKLFISRSSPEYLDNNSFPDKAWRLILITKIDNKYALRTNDKGPVEIESTDSFNICIGGSLNTESFKGYVWHFAIFNHTIDLTEYYSDTNNNYCLKGDCQPCSLAFIDPTYGTICISNQTDDKKDAESNACTDTRYGCSGNQIYNCGCISKSCYFNIVNLTSECLSLTGDTSCSGSLVDRNGECCLEECQSCENSNECLTCMDPLANVTDGRCQCTDHYFGNVSSSSVTNCQECDDVCGKCVNSSSYCLTCSDTNADAVVGGCLCKDGYYDKDISDDAVICEKCSSGCKNCTNFLFCNECFDENAIIVNGNCVCKAGMYGTVSSVSSESGCSLCHVDCAECSDYAYCTKCSNTKAYPLDGVCLCKDHYYKLPGKPIVTCRSCNEDCKKCVDSKSCTECNSKYAVPHITQGCQCKQSYFNTSSLTKYSSCQKCADLCLTCSSLDYCTECTGINTQLVSNKCTCSPGYYYSGRPSNDCIICTDYKVSETCRLNCAKGTGWYKGQCVECKKYCLDCDDDLMCLECTDGMQIVNGICECFRAEVIVDGKCEPKYFNVAISVGVDNRISLEFSENTEILLGVEHIKLYFYGVSQNFEVSGTDFKNYYLKETKFGFFLQNTDFKLEISKVLYSTDNSQLIDYKFTGYFTATPITPFAAAIKSTTKSVMTVTFASAMVSNPAACWILINTIQIITYMPLTLLDYPSDIIEFLNAIGDYSIIPNFMPKIVNKDSSSQPIERLQKSGIETSVFWVNVGPNTVILVLYIIFSPFIYLGSKLPYTYKICQEMLKNFRYNLFIRFWTETYLEFGLFSLIQMESSIKTDDGYFNLITAIVFIFLVSLTPFYTFYLLYSKRNNLNDLKVSERIGSLYCEFKSDRGLISSLFYLVFFIRRLQYVLTQILLSDYWYAQYGLNLFFTLLQFGYFLYFRPFKDKLVLFSELIGETCVLLLFIYSGFLLPGEKKYISTSIISKIFIYTVMISLGMQTLLSTTSLILVIKSWYNKYKNLKIVKDIKRKNKVFPEKTNHTMSDILENSPN